MFPVLVDIAPLGEHTCIPLPFFPAVTEYMEVFDPSLGVRRFLIMTNQGASGGTFGTSTIWEWNEAAEKFLLRQSFPTDGAVGATVFKPPTASRAALNVGRQMFILSNYFDSVDGSYHLNSTVWEYSCSS